MQNKCRLSLRIGAVFMALAFGAVLFTACDDGTREFTLFFFANGGEGSPPGAIAAQAGSLITLPGQGQLSRDGYNFGGWNRDPSGAAGYFTANQSISMPNENMRLYARWVALPALTGTVSISGTAQVGMTLTADIAYLGGSGTPSFEWRRAGTPIPGETGNTYVVQDADVGTVITVRVTRPGNSGYIISSPSATVTDLPALTGTVTIVGTPQLGQTLMANTDALGGIGTVSFEWRRAGTPIPDADDSIHIVQAADVGSTLTVRVTREGNSGYVDSEPTATVAGLPALTGVVSITGLAQIGQTLTANTAALGGTGIVSFEWRRAGTPIAGANDSTYVVQAADAGSALTVRVTREGNSGYVDSAPTEAVPTHLTGTVSITGTAQVGQMLMANIAGLGGTGAPSFEWRRGGLPIAGATGNIYTVQAADIGSAITVRVTRAGYSGYVDSAPTAAVPPQLAGTVSITGIVAVGQTLTANIAGLGGVGVASFQWRRGGATIAGATGSTYVVQVADAGLAITVRVTRAGYSGFVDSAPTAVVPPHLTGTVSITGTVAVGQTLTANIAGLGGTGAVSFEWRRGGGPIASATGNTYVVQAADIGSTLAVRVTRAGYSGYVDSAPTAAVPSQLTGTVSITGTVQVGQTLTANIAGLGGTGLPSFEWRRGGATIAGATGSTYVVQVADAGLAITVRVTRAGYSGFVDSAPTAAVPPHLTGTVSITGTVAVGQMLTANIAGLVGTGAVSFEWRRGGVPIANATGNTYVVQAADVGSTLAVRVTRAGYSGYVDSASTATVLPTLVGTVSITGSPVVGQTLTANIAGLGGTGTTSFEWRRGGVPIPDAADNTHTLQNADIGSAITVRVTRAGYSGFVESAPTAIVTAPLPPLTGTVAITPSGIPQVGQTLTANIAGLGGTGTASFQWRRGGNPILGETNSTYTVQIADAGQTISVVVTRSGNSGEVIGGPTEPVPVALTGTVSITGTPRVGQTLTAITTTLGGAGAISFQWMRDGTPIAGANSGTYNLVAGDQGAMISVRVTRAGHSGSVSSAEVGPIAGISWTATSVGAQINFTFSSNPGTLLASDFAVTPGTGSATVGAVYGTGTTRTLSLSAVDAGTVSVSINRAGIESEAQTVTLVIITWTAAPVGTTATTSINFTFASNPGALLTSDFTVTPGTGSATITGMTGTGMTRTLSLSAVSAGTVSISIDRAGVDSAPQTVTLATIAWTATPVGYPTTSVINFTFAADPGWLSATEITIASGTGSAARGALSGTGTMRTLAVSNVSPGTVSVSINWIGVDAAPQTVTLIEGVNTWTATPVGSPITTAIDFEFIGDPVGLLWTDFAIASGTGSATITGMTGTGITRTLSLSAVSAGTVSVSINRAGIDATPQTVTLVAAPNTWTATPTGTPVTTSITFNFIADPGTMLATDFTIDSGTGSATRGNLTGAGVTRTLAVSGVRPGTVSISINRAGVASEPQTVTLAGVTWTATPTGSPINTAITISFSSTPTGLVASDFSITPGTGSATITSVTGTGTTRNLVLAGVSAGTVSISINRVGVSAVPQTVTLVAVPNTWTAVPSSHVPGAQTAYLILTFLADPGPLSLAEITITPGTGSATVVTVSGTTGDRRVLVLSGTEPSRSGTITISINRAGVDPSPRTVTIVGW